MNRTPVTSSNIASVGYDRAANILEIEFTSGSIYQYTHVPLSIYDGLISATSCGSYFSRFIKDRFTVHQIA